MKENQLLGEIVTILKTKKITLLINDIECTRNISYPIPRL